MLSSASMARPAPCNRKKLRVLIVLGLRWGQEYFGSRFLRHDCTLLSERVWALSGIAFARLPQPQERNSACLRRLLPLCFSV